MAKGNRIIVTPEPRGVFEECIVSGTPKPGTCMELKTAGSAGNRHTYEAAGTTAASGSHGMSADGDRMPVCVLLCWPEHAACPPGRTAADAYVDGERGAVYWPQPDEELNVLFMNVAGTGEDVVFGDKMIIDDGTGKILVSTGTPESEPFQALEAYTDPTADQLLWCKFSGM